MEYTCIAREEETDSIKHPALPRDSTPAWNTLIALHHV